MVLIPGGNAFEPLMSRHLETVPSSQLCSGDTLAVAFQNVVSEVRRQITYRPYTKSLRIVRYRYL
jgi:hypothetical protein